MSEPERERGERIYSLVFVVLFGRWAGGILFCMRGF